MTKTLNNKILNRLFNLPDSIRRLIFEYDGTYHEIYKTIIKEIDLFPIWNIAYNRTNALDSRATYYCKTIATDMLSHWNNHYTSFIDSLLNYQNNTQPNDRTLVNFLDNCECGSIIPGRNETLFEWIEYYNQVISK
jgi:hypothetical protein